MHANKTTTKNGQNLQLRLKSSCDRYCHTVRWFCFLHFLNFMWTLQWKISSWIILNIISHNRFGLFATLFWSVCLSRHGCIWSWFEDSWNIIWCKCELPFWSIGLPLFSMSPLEWVAFLSPALLCGVCGGSECDRVLLLWVKCWRAVCLASSALFAQFMIALYFYGIASRIYHFRFVQAPPYIVHHGRKNNNVGLLCLLLHYKEICY